MAKKGDLELYLFGDKALAKAMHGLSRAVQKRLMTKALRAEAKKIKKTVQANVPVDQGNLRRGIQVRAAKRRRNRFGMVVRTAPAEKHKGIPRSEGTKVEGYYPAHIELGTRRHAAQPYLRPALDAHRAGLTKRVGADLWAGMREHAAKEAAKAASALEVIGE